MLRDKTIQVIDFEKYPEGTFITYAEVLAGDEGEPELGRQVNAIVSSANEQRITLTLANGTYGKITLQDLESDYIRILGVKLNAI